MRQRRNKEPKQQAGKPARGRAAPIATSTQHPQRRNPATDTRFQSLLNQVAVGIAYTTTDGVILEVNKKLCEMLGYSSAELLRMTTRDLTHPDDRDRQDQMRQELLEGKRSHFSGEKRYRHKDGSDFWVSRTVALAQDTPDGKPYLIQTIDDINDRKRAEAGILRLSRAQQVMAQCSHILVQASDETAMLNSMCRVMVESGGYNQAWIGMPTGDEARPIRPVAHAGYGDDVPMRTPKTGVASSHYPWTSSGQYRGIAALTITSGRMHIVRDIMNDPKHEHIRFRAKQLGYQCSITLPLTGDGKTLGVLVLHAAERDAFDEEEIRLLNNLSADIGFGIASLQARTAREEAERLTRETENRFREIFQQAAVGITRIDLDGILVDCNQKFCDLLGYTREELIGKNTRDITHPEDYGPGAEFRMQLGSNSETTAKSRTREKRFLRKDGSPVWTRRTMSAAYDASGKSKYVIGVIEDITDHKELELHQRETFDQAAVGIVHTSMDGRYLRVNRKFCEMTGYSESELLGRLAADLSRPEDRRQDSQTRRLMWDGKLDNFSEEKQYVRKDGVIVWTNRTVSLARDASGKPLFFIRVIEDITERKEADLRYRATFDNAPIGIMHTAIDSYRILHVNRKLCEMLGYSEEELLTMTSTDIVHPDYRFTDKSNYRDPMLGSSSRTFTSERKFLHKDGSGVWVNRTVALARNTAGEPLYFIRIIEDITKRKQAEETLARERQLLRTIIDTLPDSIYVRGRDEKFILANKAWLNSRGLPDENITGKTPHDVYPKELAEKLLAQDASIIRAGIPVLKMEQQLATRGGNDGNDHWRWFSTTKVPLRNTDGEIIGTVGISTDITEQKRVVMRREMEHAVTRALAEASSLTDVMPVILQAMCKAMGWAYGARWALDEHERALNRAEYWCETEPEFDPTDREQWHKLPYSDKGRFLRHVWVDGKATWLTDLCGEQPFRRKASLLKFGWQSAYGFPILIGTQVAGIMEFFGPENIGPDETLLQSTQAIGSQIGQFIQRKEAEDKVAFLARFDTITGLPNRFLFKDRLAQLLAQSQRNHWSAGVLFVDLDHFKAINDTYGHAAGDQLLREVASRMNASVRRGDTVGRLSGDEFAVMLSNLTQADDAGLVAQKIVTALAAPFNIDGNEAYVSASIGIALYPSDGADPDVLLKNADTAMYRAKEQGRNGYQFYLPQMNERLLRRQQLDVQLRNALSREEFRLHYQPKVSVSTGVITGFEVLLRWQRGDELVPPQEFVSILEETGLIVPIGEWVLQSVCMQIRQWQQDGITPRPVAINLSARQFQRNNMTDMVGRILRETGVNPALIKLELTESMLMMDAKAAVDTLHQLKSLGVKLSVDDFGTGYSSLAYLKRFPLDELKIDREFINDAVSDPDDATITLSIINLAHSLKLRVVAEGVESEGQLNFLRSHGCDEIQGYYFSPPLPVEECTRMLVEDRRLAQAQPQDAVDADAPTLLLVVDNRDELQRLAHILKPAGYRVTTASNGSDGLEILARQSMDIAICDNDMPGMSGIEFLTRARKLYPDTLRVLASSGDDTPTLTRATNNAGIHLFLPKNWAAERLCTEIREILQARAEAVSISGHPRSAAN